MTNNGQTPRGNTTTAGAVEMARRIAREAFPPPGEAIRREGAYKAALAAIIETTEAASAFVEGDSRHLHITTARSIRRGDHLKGPKP